MPRVSLRPLLPGAACAAALLAPAAVAVPGPRSSHPEPGPIAFRELSSLSGGQYDFGLPRSTVEKATCAFVDTDGDGWDDLVSLAGHGEPHLYWRNRPAVGGGRTFVPAEPGHGLDTGACLARDGSCLAAGDVDGDGDVDLFVGNGWNKTFAEGLGRKILLLNDGTGRFTDVTEEVGVLDGDHTCCAAFFFDAELDGDLDLFACNSFFAAAGKDGDGRAHVWINELAQTGTLRFTDEAEARGVVSGGFGVWCATGVDWNGDGFGDILIGHDGPAETQLLQNDGTGHFVEVGPTIGAGQGDDAGEVSSFGDDSRAAMGIAWGDVENDGDLDVYITNIHHNPLYRNNGDGTVTEVGIRSGVRADWITWGTSFADFDLDGFVDLYVAGGDLYELSRPVVHSFLYRNRGDGTFADVTETANLRRDVPLHRENGTACADFDGDGRVDLLVSRAERSGAAPYLYRNETETAGRRWLAVALRGNGTTTNTSAIGARVRIVAEDASGAPLAGLAQLREVNGGDSRGAVSSFAQSFGLGADAAQADVTVVWPRAGTLAERAQTFADVPLDRRVTIPEAPREPSWRPAAEAAVTVPDGRATVVACEGTGEADPLTVLAVESGPAWAAPGPWQDGRTLALTPPRTDAPHETALVVLATAQGAAQPEARQALTVRVVPAPRVDAVRRSGARALVLRGDHLEIKGLTVTVDGVAVKAGRGRAFRPRKRAPYAELRVTVPKSLAKSLRRGDHVVVVTDPASGFSGTRAF